MTLEGFCSLRVPCHSLRFPCHSLRIPHFYLRVSCHSLRFPPIPWRDHAVSWRVHAVWGGYISWYGYVWGPLNVYCSPKVSTSTATPPEVSTSTAALVINVRYLSLYFPVLCFRSLSGFPCDCKPFPIRSDLLHVLISSKFCCHVNVLFCLNFFYSIQSLVVHLHYWVRSCKTSTLSYVSLTCIYLHIWRTLLLLLPMDFHVYTGVHWIWHHFKTVYCVYLMKMKNTHHMKQC